MFVRASGKFVVLDVVLQKLKLCGHRVLIYSPWTQTLEMIAELLRLREHRFLELTGATTGENRDRLIGQFNADSSVFAFLVSTHAGGEGVNLQVADTVIIFESDWNPQRDKQAKARVHRLGQERKVLCLNLVSVGEEFESQDQKKFGRADNKRKMEEKVIGAGNFVESTTDRDRIETVSSMYRDEEQDGLLFRKTDQLDRLIARDEEELEKLAKNPIPMPELLTMAELPLWIKTPNVKKPKDRGVTDGVRKRKVVSYKEQKINSDEEDSDDGPTPMQIEENEQEQQEEQEVEEEEEEEEEEVGEQPEPLRVQESTTVKIKLKRPRPVADLRENQEFMETFTSLSYSAPDLIGADEFPELGDLDDLNWL
jgi:superfamily II DNA/RNA helicase